MVQASEGSDGWTTDGESVGQDYERDRLVGWTTSEEVRGSTTSSEAKMKLHTTHKGYESAGYEIFKDK